MRRTIDTLFLALLAAGCVTATSDPIDLQPFPPSVVELPVPRGAAYDLVLASLVEAGYTIEDGDRPSGRLKTAAVPGESSTGSALGGLFVVSGISEYFINATIVPTETGSRVLLGATMRSTTTSSSGTRTSEEGPVYECAGEFSEEIMASCRAAQQRLRTRLDTIAEDVRARSAVP